MKLLIAFISAFLISNSMYSQPLKRKLVVGIVVDQMRPDYLYKYYNQYCDSGFKLLLKDGFVCKNTRINYVPTVTAPGHASIYAGTTPRYHGIVENEWFDRKSGKIIYCVKDTTYLSIGNATDTNQTFSPANLIVTNISDELKMSDNGKSKVIAMSLKDRGAVLPAGHLADEAYWFDQKTGNFISSTYYIKTFPEWAKAFNAQKKAQEYVEMDWNYYEDSTLYINSISDNNRYESKFPGKSAPVFPYSLKEISRLKKIPYYGVYYSPFGNSILTDFAIEAIKNTDIGNDNFADILAISYSSTDAVGHLFGPQSKELNDTYVRLDRDLARLIKALDSNVGKENYTLFLTADHGAGEVPSHLTDLHIPAGYIDTADLMGFVRKGLNVKYGPGNMVTYTNGMFYLNYKLARSKNINILDMQDYLAEILRTRPEITEVYTSKQLSERNYESGIAQLVQKGFNKERCGDVVIIYKANWNEKSSYATSHGTPFDFDTHIPLIWYGTGINPGETFAPINVTDIAPTVSALLNIKNPGACIGNPISDILKCTVNVK